MERLVRRPSSAIVIGGSIGGMCVARVLSQHFQSVTIVDADDTVAAEGARKGVPQSSHPHALSLRGRDELEKLFPGLRRALQDAGALELDQGTAFARYTASGWAKRFRADITVLGCTRPLLEATIRRLFRSSTTNVAFMERTRVVELLSDPTAPKVVCGVQIRRPDGSQETLHADLVVDVSGRASRIEKWLETLGTPITSIDRVDSHATYATRLYEAPRKEHLNQAWWRGVMIDPSVPGLPRWGMLVPVEHNRWLVTAGGISHVRPPLDGDAWLAYLRTLRSPLIADMLEHATPLSEVAQSRSTDCRWRRLDKLTPPGGFLAIGDAVACFNPTYGQGITSAAMQAALLDDLMRSMGPEHPRLQARFFKGQAKIVSGLWDFSAALDLRWPDADGVRPPLFALQRLATLWFDRAAQEDTRVLRALLPIVHATGSRTAFLRPSLLTRVFTALLGLSLRGSSLHQDPRAPKLLQLSQDSTDAHLSAELT